MKNEYRLIGESIKLECQVEKEVLSTLHEMSAHTGFTIDELVNTALKRYQSQHKDFLPGNLTG